LGLLDVHQETLKENPRFVCGVKEVYEKTHMKKNQGTPFR